MKEDGLLCGGCVNNLTRKNSSECLVSGYLVDSPEFTFNCANCNAGVDAKNGVFNHGVLKCRKCAGNERIKCINCGKCVIEGLLRACAAVWHKDCLNCQFCKVNVADKVFANISQKPCCRDCYQQLKADRKGHKKVNDLRHFDG
jgi:hypothetical protein